MNYQQKQYFNSFDEFNTYPHGWDANFSTTSAGAYRVVLKQSAAPGFFMNTALFSCPTLQQASTPLGMRTFALPLRLPNPYCWRGLEVGVETFMIFPTDRDLFSMMGADSEVMTISVDQRLVDSCLQRWQVNPDETFGLPRTTQLSKLQYDALLRNMGLMTEFMIKYGDHTRFPELSHGIQEYLLENMLQPVIGHMEQPNPSESTAAKRVKKAADYILSRLGGPVTVGDICDHIGCSRRSLEQCFRKYAGTSPKQFIQIMRLEHCRRALLASAPDSKISSIALQHGFWHMGQFAADYKRLFGELPSATVTENRKI